VKQRTEEEDSGGVSAHSKQYAEKYTEVVGRGGRSKAPELNSSIGFGGVFHAKDQNSQEKPCMLFRSAKFSKKRNLRLVSALNLFMSKIDS
jgi:hypothetical protein